MFGRALASPRAALWLTVGWRVAQLLILAGLAYAAWTLLGHIPYRIDIDVYRMGGQAWLDGRPLYADGATFHTRVGLEPAVHLSPAGGHRCSARSPGVASTRPASPSR